MQKPLLDAGGFHGSPFLAGGRDEDVGVVENLVARFVILLVECGGDLGASLEDGCVGDIRDRSVNDVELTRII